MLGCKYKFYPEKPLKRKIIRGSILGSKIVAAPLVASLALVAGLGILVFGCVALPIYGSYRLAKHVKVSSAPPAHSLADPSLTVISSFQSVKIKKTIGKNLKNALSSESIAVQAKHIDLHYSIESNTNLSHISVPNNESSGFIDNHSSQSAQNLPPCARSAQLTKRAKSQCLESVSDSGHSGDSLRRARSKSSNDLGADQVVPAAELLPTKSAIVSACFQK